MNAGFTVLGTNLAPDFSLRRKRGKICASWKHTSSSTSLDAPLMVVSGIELGNLLPSTIFYSYFAGKGGNENTNSKKDVKRERERMLTNGVVGLVAIIN